MLDMNFRELCKAEVRRNRLPRSLCILRARNRPPTERGSMAREKPRREIDRTVRCGNGHEFTVKQELVGHDEGEGTPVVKWERGNIEEIAECPVPGCFSTNFKLVEE
jgi:hypothetical protein